MIKALNLGCGRDIRRSDATIHWTNADIAPRQGAVYLDMRNIPWIIVEPDAIGSSDPVPDETFDYVLADNVLEHFDNHDFIAILNEIDRVTKVGGRVEIVVPHKDSQGSVQDPTHKMLFVPRSALYWNQVQTPFGGRAVGITANLVCTKEPEVTGNMATEAFIRYKLTKMSQEKK